jgi:site-specific DNA recombinase
MGWKDEAYLEDLKNKTRRGLAGRAQRGLSAGGRAYGYHTVPVTDPQGRTDAHGAPLVLGYRREICESEARVVRRIFQAFADGQSPDAIAKQLNAEGVAPPRPKRGHRARGWAGTTIYGSPRLGTGILNNSLYAGRYLWNRFTWVRNPETGKRVPRLRPESEWIVTEAPELRIVSGALWDQVKARQIEITRRVRGLRGGYVGQHPKYLLSGLIKCGHCEANYVVRSRNRYVCSSYLNRGREICPNSLTTDRTTLERRVVEFIRNKLYTQEALDYLVERVSEALHARLRQDHAPDRERLRAELGEIERQLANVEQAILQGIFTETTARLLKDLEAKRRQTLAQLETPPRSVPVELLRFLPSAVQRHLQNLHQTLRRDVPKARGLLRKVISEVRLIPVGLGEPSAYLEGEVVGNKSGLLSLQPALADTIGSGGRI